MTTNYYYSEREWDRLGCGPLPECRKYPSNTVEQNQYLVFPEQAEGDDSDYKRNPYSPA